MNSDINLIGNIKKPRPSEHKLFLIRRVALITGISTGILALIVFFISFRYSASFTKNQQAQALAKMIPYQKTISNELLLKDRVNQIEKIEAERQASSIPIDAIISKKPSDVNAVSLLLDKDALQIKFSSDSLVSISDFIESVKKLKESDIGKIKISSLDYTTLGYSVIFLINK